MRIFGARSGNFEKNAVVSESGNGTACTKNSWRLLAMGNQWAMCETRQLQFLSRYQKAWKSYTIKSISEFFHAAEWAKIFKNLEVPVEKVPVVECLDGLARFTSKELAITHVKSGTLQNTCSTRTRMVAVLGKSAHTHTVRLMNSRRNSKSNNDKSAVAVLKKGIGKKENLFPMNVTIDRGNLGRRSDKKLWQNSSKRESSDARQLGCVFQNMTPPKSFLRKSTDMPKPIQRVKFTKAISRHTKIRDQNPSLGYFCPGEPHERSPNAPKFQDRSQEETEWQEQGAREAAWKLAKSVLELKEHERAAFFSSPENRCLPASTLKPEEKEFVVDSGASVHMISKKDPSKAEMDILTKS